MTRWIAFLGIVLLGVTAVVVSERRKVDVPASPAALLYLVADTEQELARMPVTFTRMPDEEEIRIGDELARSYAARVGQQDIAEVNVVEHYMTRVGSELASRAHRKLPYKFHYIPDSNLINAFALPGGHVYVGGGLLGLMDSEDELAAVMGHEIEHIDHYHCADRVQQQEALRKVPLGGLLELPIELFVAGYSKDQELEADREGTRLAVQAGYSANGAIRMFETFDRLHKEYQAKAKTPQDEMSQLAQQALEGYFRSHPLPAERIAQVQKIIASEGW
jgi:predicted Zn-dependent protease